MQVYPTKHVASHVHILTVVLYNPNSGNVETFFKIEKKKIKSHEPIFYSQLNMDNITNVLNWDILHFYAQIELVSNLMPAIGLKIVGTGACLPWCSISSSFQDSLKTSGHRVYEFLEFCCWNLVPFLTDIGFRLLKSSWSSLTYFSFNDSPNVLYRWTIRTAGRTIQHPDSSTMNPCCCNGCSMWFCIVLLKYTRPSLK